VLFGNDDGTLRAYESAGGPSGARALAGEDFDADGFVDLATAHSANLVTVLRNTGEERFDSAGSYPVGGTPVALAATDVDGDGSIDLVTANRGANDVSILLGVGDGQFQQQSRLRVGRAPTGLAIADLDADGTLDLVIANRGSKTATVMLNGVDAPQPVVCLVPGVARRTLAVARRLVAAANCRVGSVRRKYSKRVRRGRVISVSPQPRTRAPVDTAVTLLVSKGRKR
jgi:FG-GAP-like repeat/PASTA domain